MSNRWRPFKLKFSAILLPTFWTNRIRRNIYVSLPCCAQVGKKRKPSQGIFWFLIFNIMTHVHRKIYQNKLSRNNNCCIKYNRIKYWKTNGEYWKASGKNWKTDCKIPRGIVKTERKRTVLVWIEFQPTNDKRIFITQANSEYTCEPVHSRSLISAFAVNSYRIIELPHDKNNKMSRPFWSESSLCTQWVAKGLKFSSCSQRILWSDWADAQADLSLRWARMPFCWFCHDAAHSEQEEDSGKDLLSDCACAIEGSQTLWR